MFYERDRHDHDLMRLLQISVRLLQSVVRLLTKIKIISSGGVVDVSHVSSRVRFRRKGQHGLAVSHMPALFSIRPKLNVRGRGKYKFSSSFQNT